MQQQKYASVCVTLQKVLRSTTCHLPWIFHEAIAIDISPPPTDTLLKKREVYRLAGWGEIPLSQIRWDCIIYVRNKWNIGALRVIEIMDSLLSHGMIILVGVYGVYKL